MPNSLNRPNLGDCRSGPNQDYGLLSLVQQFTFFMCLMVCANTVFTPPLISSSTAVAAATARHSTATRVVPQVQPHFSLHSTTFSSRDNSASHFSPVFQTESPTARNYRAIRTRTGAIQSAEVKKSNLVQSTALESQKHDCDHFSAQLLPPIRPRKPCFLGTVPTSISVNEGDSILLQCIVYNVNFSTVVISWWREGWFRELTLGLETYNARYRLPRVSYQDWSLQITNVRPEDSGIYVCQINLEQIVEKFFEVKVQKKAKLSKLANAPEHEFVKDEAFSQGVVPQMRIEGQNEGFVGSSMTLSCIVQNALSSTTTALVWSHGTGSQRYFISSTNNGRTDMEYLLKSYLETDPATDRLSTNRLDIRAADEQQIRITTSKQGNHTIRSELLFTRLTMDHAGVWRCSKITYPIGRITEEAKMMVYVRAKKPTFKSQSVAMTTTHGKSSARSLHFRKDQYNRALWGILVYGVLSGILL